MSVEPFEEPFFSGLRAGPNARRDGLFVTKQHEVLLEQCMGHALAMTAPGGSPTDFQPLHLES